MSFLDKEQFDKLTPDERYSLYSVATVKNRELVGENNKLRAVNNEIKSRMQIKEMMDSLIKTNSQLTSIMSHHVLKTLDYLN